MMITWRELLLFDEQQPANGWIQTSFASLWKFEHLARPPSAALSAAAAVMDALLQRLLFQGTPLDSSRLLDGRPRHTKKINQQDKGQRRLW
jgi:hypothetical protein